MRLLFLIIFYQVSITSHMGSDTDVQPSLCLERELSRLQEILRTKQETCSEVHKVADEQADEKGTRRAKKEAEREELRRKLSRIISEQEEERNRHIEDSAADDLLSGPLSQVLEEAGRERITDLTAFVQECGAVQNEYREQLMAAIRESRS